MKKVIVIFGMLLLAGTYTALAGEVQVSSSVDKSHVQIDEEVSFTIRILGARGNLQAPRLPHFDGFDSFYTGRTSQFTFVNGKSSATVEFSYILVPKVAGRFTLDPIQVWIDGKTYATQALEVEVLGPQVQPVSSAGRATPPFAPTATPPTRVPTRTAAPFVTQPVAASPQVVNDENVFIRASVDKLTAFPNEQVLLSYTLFTRYDTRYEGFEEEPVVSGFWMEDFPLDRDLGRDTVTVNGKRYVKADVRKIALFPTAPAEYTINPGVLKISIREEPKTTSLFDEFFGDSFFSGSSFFARRVERLLKPDPIIVNVRPFPEKGKPASFNGAVGQFRMSATVDKNEVKQNEPVTLKLVLEGEGNVETLPKPPIPELTSFKVYDGDSSTQLLKSGMSLGGRKEFEVIFIPTQAGEMAIPPLEFSFFEPRSQNYQVLRTSGFPLKVAPSDEPLRLPAHLAQEETYKQDIRRESQDIRYIHEEIPSDRMPRILRLLYGGLLGANLLGLVLVATGLLRSRKEALFARDLGLKRRTLARPVAHKRLKSLRRLARSQKQEEAGRFIDEAEKVLSDYLSDKFNLSAYSFTREWLEQKLAELWGAEDPDLKEIHEFYEGVTEIRFGRGVIPTREREQYLTLIEKTIRRIEKSL